MNAFTPVIYDDRGGGYIIPEPYASEFVKHIDTRRVGDLLTLDCMFCQCCRIHYLEEGRKRFRRKGQSPKRPALCPGCGCNKGTWDGKYLRGVFTENLEYMELIDLTRVCDEIVREAA